MKKAVQQIMLGTVTKNEKQTAETLRRIKAAGYDGIELNGFMVKPTSFLVRMLTKAAGQEQQQHPCSGILDPHQHIVDQKRYDYDLHDICYGDFWKIHIKRRLLPESIEGS